MSLFNRNMIPSNLVEACFRKVRTQWGTFCFMQIFTLQYVLTKMFFLLCSQYKTSYTSHKPSRTNVDFINVTELRDNGKVLPFFFLLSGESCLDQFFIACYCRTASVMPIPVVDDRVPVPGTADGINLLGLLVFCIAFGLVLGRMGNEGTLLRDFFDCLNKAIMRLVGILIW